jgi:hypothetical protein
MFDFSARRTLTTKQLTSFVCFVCFVCFVFPACGTSPARAEEAPQVTTTWRAVGAWSGDGSRQTESFDVTTGALRLRWETRATSSNAPFKVWLHSAISGRPLQLVAESTGTGSGTAAFADEPRVSYLVVESQHVTWSMQLDEATQSPVR